MIKYARIKSFVLAVLLTVGVMSVQWVDVQAANYWPEGPEIEAPSAIVMEANTGTILYENNIHEQLYPASITKILTTLLAIENSTMDEEVEFSHDAVHKTEGSGISRDVGEIMTMEETLYAVMLESANECAYAAAEHVGGTVENFVDLMNTTVKEWGCVDTHFNNPHGLPDEDHYTSSYDMAVISRHALQNEVFRKIVGTKKYVIPPTNKHKDTETYLVNHHKMLKNGEYYYEYCIGGKTGYTDAALNTLVTFAEKDGMTLICVVLKEKATYHYKDSLTLLNYCFDNFQILNIADNETSFDSEYQNAGLLNTNDSYVELDKDGMIVIPKTAEFAEAESQISYDSTDENVVATLKYTFEGHEVGEADIVATGATVEDFPFNNIEDATEAVTEQSTKKAMQIDVKKIFVILFGIAAGVVCIFLLIKFIDNIYIIKHKLLGNRKNEAKKYRTIKDTRKFKHRKRRRWRFK